MSACCVMFSLIPFGGFNLLSSILLCQSFPRAVISSLGCARVHVCALLRSQLQLSGSMTCMVAVGDSSWARDQDLDKRHHTTFVRSSFFKSPFQVSHPSSMQISKKNKKSAELIRILAGKPSLRVIVTCTP